MFLITFHLPGKAGDNSWRKRWFQAEKIRTVHCEEEIQGKSKKVMKRGFAQECFKSNGLIRMFDNQECLIII